MALAAHDGDLVKSRPNKVGEAGSTPASALPTISYVHVAQDWTERPENGWVAWREGYGCTEWLVAGSVGKRVSQARLKARVQIPSWTHNREQLPV